MKKLGYLLMMLMVLVGLSLNAQTYGKPYRSPYAGQKNVSGVYQQMPSVSMRSTSTLYSSGSTLPQAAITGTYTADEMNAPARIGPRRVGEGGGFADDEDPDLPGDTVPLGDAVLPLMLCALAFCGVVYLRRRRTALSR